ncbi:MAG: hypothetical protein WBB44_07900 [Candidatus Nanopelagicales bacterium]|nr:hypothetical protein [Candidatus Nanopelagicales bacterium]
MTSLLTVAGHALRAVSAAAVGALALTGCSGTVVGLAQSGNMNVIYLATASNDLLLANKIAVYQSPRCTVTNKIKYDCLGKTIDRKIITASVPDGSSDDPIMTLTVGKRQIYHGSVAAVLQDDARTAP